MTSGATATADLVRELAAAGLTVAVAESLTGGLLAAELIRPAGASAVVVGGVVAYDTALKRSVLGVDADLLAVHGPVHPDVARQMAAGVRRALAVEGRMPDLGIATTGVAGPGPQGEHPAGEAYVALDVRGTTSVRALRATGDRDEVRAAVVTAALALLRQALVAERE